MNRALPHDSVMQCCLWRGPSRTSTAARPENNEAGIRVNTVSETISRNIARTMAYRPLKPQTTIPQMFRSGARRRGENIHTVTVSICARIDLRQWNGGGGSGLSTGAGQATHAEHGLPDRPASGPGPCFRPCRHAMTASRITQQSIDSPPSDGRDYAPRQVRVAGQDFDAAAAPVATGRSAAISVTALIAAAMWSLVLNGPMDRRIVPRGAVP